MANSEYNFTSRLLHRMALQSTSVAEISFDIENATISKKGIEFSDNPVFVTGLARSGTTMLMRQLYESGEFRSLTYMDMPFVLMPNLWKNISQKKQNLEFKERAHKDGILVNFESPEALEEIFWRVFCGDKYIGKTQLNVHKVDKDIQNKFKDYIHNVILSSDIAEQRYLSKNNNNILRLPYLQKIFPQAKIIIPFRDPLQHAVSLFSQHKHFSEVQSNDNFSLNYMNWLGHFEFGLNQKPFFLSDNDTFSRMEGFNKMDLNFWLLSWKNYYEYAIKNTSDENLFFCYEIFCQDPTRIMNKLFRLVNIKNRLVELNPFIPAEKPVTGFDSSILEECKVIYNQLKEKFNMWYEEKTQFN